MDAQNDTEVVKQSMSSTISVFTGMVMIGITLFLLFKAVQVGLSNIHIMLIFIGAYVAIYIALELFLHKTGNKSFENIEV